jgi:hypothetical protein
VLEDSARNNKGDLVFGQLIVSNENVSAELISEIIFYCQTSPYTRKTPSQDGLWSIDSVLQSGVAMRDIPTPVLEAIVAKKLEELESSDGRSLKLNKTTKELLASAIANKNTPVALFLRCLALKTNAIRNMGSEIDMRKMDVWVAARNGEINLSAPFPGGETLSQRLIGNGYEALSREILSFSLLGKMEKLHTGNAKNVGPQLERAPIDRKI